jgi:hypothetical protein
VPRDSAPRKTALARASTRQTRHLAREDAPQKKDRNCQKVINIWSQAPDGCFIPRHTGRLTVGRNIRLRLHLQESLESTVGREESIVRESPGSTDVNPEAEEATMLEAVIRQPVKIQQTEKNSYVL